MRTLLIIAFGLCMATCTFAETNTGETRDCFGRLAKDTRAGDSITVFTDDSTVVRGSRPIINSTSSILYMRTVTESGFTHSVTIPFDRISKITYLKPASSRAGLILLGFALGAVAGGFVGAALAQEEEGFMDFSRLHAAMAGGMLGGMIGAAGGYHIGKDLAVKVTLVCWK